MTDVRTAAEVLRARYGHLLTARRHHPTLDVNRLEAARQAAQTTRERPSAQLSLLDHPRKETA